MVASVPELIRKIIAEDLYFAPIDKRTLRLSELKTSEPLSVDIRYDDYQVFCFSIDKDRNSGESTKDLIFPFFNARAAGVLSKNDFILIAQKQKEVCVFVIELKSKNHGDYLKQLLSARAFMQFVFAKARICHPEFKAIDDCKFKYKGILFCQPPISNKPSEERSKSKNKKVEFKEIQDLPITKQSYDNVYYLFQFF